MRARAYLAWMLAVALIGCGGQLPARATAVPSPSQLPADGPFARPSYEPIEFDFEGALPQSADFANARVTVLSAHVSNTHPYPIFSDPQPGESVYGILLVEVANVGQADLAYQLGDEAFSLRTWSGQQVAVLHRPGVRPFSRLAAGARAEDRVVFPLPSLDALEGASLLVGEPPDVPAIVTLSTAPPPPDYPRSLSPATSDPLKAGAVEWLVSGGSLEVDTPAEFCCLETGLRANEDEVFVVLDLRGTVRESQYGQATVSTDELRLIVDGERFSALRAEGRPNIAEGESLELVGHWLVPVPFNELALEVGGGSPQPTTVELVPAVKAGQP